MTRETFKSWCKLNGVTSINKEIRTNTNGYPFITILRDKDAENIYFGRKSAAKVELGDSVKAIANDLYVTIAVNADGQPRTKLSFDGVSSYEDLDSMFD